MNDSGHPGIAFYDPVYRKAVSSVLAIAAALETLKDPVVTPPSENQAPELI